MRLIFRAGRFVLDLEAGLSKQDEEQGSDVVDVDSRTERFPIGFQPDLVQPTHGLDEQDEDDPIDDRARR